MKNSNELQSKLENYINYTFWIAAAKAAAPRGESPSAVTPFSIEKTASELASIKNFVLSLPDSKEKLLLYYRYIRGMSMERTAELLGVSTRSAYRVRARALEYAQRIYAKSC